MKISEKAVKLLKKEVILSNELKEIPVGAVIIDKLGNIISSGHNTRQSTHNVLGHAEINAILDATNSINDWRLDGYCMIVSLKPCNMCYSVIKESRIDQVFYFLENDKATYADNKVTLVDKEISKDEFYFFKSLLTDFFNNMR